jgi:hypothetical protein
MLWGRLNGESMYATHESTLAAEPMSEAEREKVREQLNRILETNHFKNSRRYPALLRFIVEETLEGRGEYLKERLIGIRVFDRPADYDTAADPVVRVTIAEVRKRIAQYYHDEQHDAEMRIELLPGHYAPEFRSRVERNPAPPASTPAETAASVPTPPAAAPILAEASPVSNRRIHPWLIAGLACGTLIVGLCSVAVARWLQPSNLDQLWAPLLSAHDPILFCLPTDVGKKRTPQGDILLNDLPPASRKAKTTTGSNLSSGPTFLDFESLGQNVVYSDMLATLRISSVLAVRHRDSRVRLNNSINLEDLRQGPAVLVGGLDNQWTIRAIAPLRFKFAGSDEDRYWISDANNPGNRSWSLDLKQQYGSVTRDYAIVARLHNEQTGQPEMIVAGIGMSGTAAAGEFIADEHHAEELRQRIGAGFKSHDFEAVLSTDVVNGIAGSAKIIAVTVW